MLPKLITENLILKETEIEDAEAIDAFLTPEYYEFQGTDPTGPEDTAVRIKQYLEHRNLSANQRMFRFTVFTKDTNTVIGQASLTRHFFPQIASLGIGIGAKYQNKGYATEMAKRIVKYGFDDLKLHRIEADVSTNHKACLRVMEKVGMTLEGIIRECIWHNNQWQSEAKLSILEREFYQ